MKQILLCLLVFLSACAGPRRNNEISNIYDLGPLVGETRVISSDPGLLLEVRIASWFDGLNVQYRLLYDDPTRLRDYAQARWAAAPVSLVQHRLRQRLGVPVAQSGVKAPCTLSIYIDEFSQNFVSPVDGRASIRGEARLLGKGRQLLAVQVIRIEKTAATPDARGGIAALAAATDGLAMDLAEWLKKNANESAGCRGG